MYKSNVLQKQRIMTSKYLKISILMIVALFLSCSLELSTAGGHTSEISTERMMRTKILTDSITNMRTQLKKSITNYIKYEPKKRNWLLKMTDDQRIINRTILPSITIAQAAVETYYGNNSIGYNIFGIKGKGYKKKTFEFINGKYIVCYQDFAKFNTLTAALKQHETILARYNLTGSYKEQAYSIQMGGYATAPNYAKTIISIIEGCDLYLLDNIREIQLQLREI